MPVRDVEDPDVATRDLAELAGALGIRPERPPDAEEVRAEPERVATLDGAGRLDPTGGRDPRRPRPRLERARLEPPAGLARPERDRAGIRDEERIEGVDEIGAVELGVEPVDPRPERRQDLDEPIVLVLGEG